MYRATQAILLLNILTTQVKYILQTKIYKSKYFHDNTNKNIKGVTVFWPYMALMFGMITNRTSKPKIIPRIS